MAAGLDAFGSRALLEGTSEPVYLYRLDVLEKQGLGAVSRLPFSIKILLEALLRQVDGFAVTAAGRGAAGRVEG